MAVVLDVVNDCLDEGFSWFIGSLAAQVGGSVGVCGRRENCDVGYWDWLVFIGDSGFFGLVLVSFLDFVCYCCSFGKGQLNANDVIVCNDLFAGVGWSFGYP